MKTFWIQTLGCKVNHYESEQVAALLRSRGWVEADSASADLRIVNSCSVTSEAASKSRQSTRRAVRLPVLGSAAMSRTIVMGCWATSDPQAAASIQGVDAVVTHHENVHQRIVTLLDQWESTTVGDSPKSNVIGTRSLPMLGHRQTDQQRAFLKIQDGCDAHCTYCIIPKLRPSLWSKPIDEVLEEARRLVEAGHLEIVLTGIFLGAYGHATALRRRQQAGSGSPLARLIENLCSAVPGLRRIRLSSLEPGDLDDDLFHCLRSHPQVVPHFHLPLQSGSSAVLRKMNRQYSRDDFLRLLDRIGQAFERPALTSDIIVGFPGETDADFQQTLEIVDRARFIHIHAFPFSPRPGTAAARWQDDFVPGPIVNRRMDELRWRAEDFSLAFRSRFIDQVVQLLVERPSAQEGAAAVFFHHGRCERYFDVQFQSELAGPGDLVNVRIDRATSRATYGTLLSIESKSPEPAAA
jgi:threonylcarbamoyladenosine tRNA methylthiotransferase MtaB